MSADAGASRCGWPAGELRFPAAAERIAPGTSRWEPPAALGDLARWWLRLAGDGGDELLCRRLLGGSAE